MLKQNPTQRQSSKRRHSVEKRKKTVTYRLSTPKTSLLPATPPTSSSKSSSSSSSSSSLLSLSAPPPDTKEEFDPTTQLPMGALQAVLKSPSILTLEMGEEEEMAYVDRRSYAEKMDFFESFKEIPDIENISADISVADVDETVDVEVTKLPKDVPKDEGKFVDPLLGLRESVSSFDAELEVNQAERISAVKPKTFEPEPEPKSKPKPKPEPEPGLKRTQELQLSELMITESQTLGSQASELNELVLPDYTEFSEVITEATIHAKEMVEAPEDMLENLIEQVDVTDEDEDKDKDIDWYTLAREREIQKLQEQTKEFLSVLIRKVVERSEFRTKEEILAENLDKRKLLVELAEKCLQYQNALDCNRALERKVVGSLIRKELISQLRPSKYDLRILPYIADMSEFRKRISSTRFRLILLEVTQAELNNKLAELKALGNDYTVDDYYTLHHKNQELQKKIEVTPNHLRH
ncbi:hypothetical protein DOY81_012018 [Sarcophaga bullata]|nr:hypothetical protein DOY81_012018 [Sarcophaga bullata]